MPQLKRFICLIGIIFSVSIFNSATHAKLPRVRKNDPLPANLFVELAKIVNPAVVNISTSRLPGGRRSGRGFYNDPFFDLFGPFMFPQHSVPQQALGTGFIIREDGLIITNNHVIEKADIIKVQLSEDDKELYEAEVIGKDSRTDIALIKISAKKKLPVIKLGSSEKSEVGEWVAAFGNPFGHGHTMTKGIISAINREIDELNRFAFIQTDASINPGNSGGPLVNTRGEVIGVNTAVDARAQGIGFAIPIDSVKSILKTLEKDGHIKRGFLGVSLANILDQRIADSLNLDNTKGALIEHVYEGTPADRAGIQPYDFIVQVGKNKVTDSSELIRSIADQTVGTKIKVKLIRDGKPKTLSVKIEEHPEDKKLRKPVRKKTYAGQKAPFDLGFKVTNYTQRLRKDFNLPKITKKRPVVIEIQANSPASRSGLIPGDIILDINKTPVKSARDVLRKLRPQFNVLRILRGDRSVLLYLRSY